MHNAAYRALGIDAHYRAYDVAPARLAAAVADFRARGVRQLSVSIPHKEAMLALVDELEPVARAIGALNTVLRVGDRLIGTNTDWIGVAARPSSGSSRCAGNARWCSGPAARRGRRCMRCVSAGARSSC